MRGLVGRAHELELVRRALVDAPIVALAGAPGVGKSAIAAALAATPVTAFGRARLVSVVVALGGARTVGDVVARIGVALGSTERTSAGAAAALAARRVLAIFDDADAAGPALEELLAAWRPWSVGGRALVTARRAFTHERAHVLRVRPLAPPALEAEVGALADSPAVELLLEELRRRDLGRAFGEREFVEAASLARAVDGLPLALRTIAAVADRTGLADAAGAVAAVRAALAPRVGDMLASLSPEAVSLARSLSLIEGSFDRHVADALAGDAAVELLGALVDASLVESRVGGGAQPFAMLRPVRLALASTLDDAASRVVRRALVVHFAQGPVSEDVLVDGDAGALAVREPRTRAYLDAVALGMGAEARRLFRSIAPSWLAAGPLSRLLELVDAAKALPRDREGDATFAFFRAMTQLFLGRPKLAASGFASAERAAPRLLAAVAASQRGVIAGLRGDFARGVASCRHAAALLPPDAPPALRGRVHKNLATVLAEKGDELALDELALAEACFRRAGDRREVAFVRLLRLGQLVDGGQIGAALRLAPSVLAALEDSGDRRSGAWANVIVGIAEQESGALGRAREHFGRARAAAQAVGDEHTSGLVAHYVARLALEEGDAVTATEESTDAVALLDVAGDSGHAALALAVLAAAHRMGGRLAAARVGAKRALARLPRRGRGARRAAVVALAAHALGRGATSLPSTAGEELRFVERFVSGARRHPTKGHALVVAADGSWFARAGERAVVLGRSPMLRALLDALARLRERRPGSSLPAASLARRVWPRARFDDATKNRLYVGVARLRALGLRDALEHDALGYRLDATLPIRRVAGEPPRESQTG